jgi:DMSO/TMAO reductase YedYZ molybdopterin-dependent catalytic subunit
MGPRVVDWALLALTLIGIGTGLASFLVGDERGRLLFAAHGALGLAVLGVLAAKLRRVQPRLTTPGKWRPGMVAGVLTTLAALATVGIGIWWVVVQTPINYPNGMILHTTAGFVLLGLCLWHLVVRFRPLPRRELTERRTLLKLGAVLLGGGAVWGSVEAGVRVMDAPGKQRRFTGSRLADGGEDGPFPVTNWMFDPIPPLDVEAYRLEVGGLVARPMRLTLDELGGWSGARVRATLDCTGGWYTVQEWQGVRVGDLLDAAAVQPGAAFVRFSSATGYRWSLPIDEARAAILATQVGGAALTAGHGAPLRLVASGRRGFQWVKWVTRVEVLDRGDAGQWAAIFTSGLDGR